MAAHLSGTQLTKALNDEFAGKNDIKRIVRSLNALPSHPAIVIKMLDTLLGNDPDPLEISRMIEADQALALKVLELAGSSGMKTGSRPASIEQALKLLGQEELCSLIVDLSRSKQPTLEPGSKSKEDLTSLSKHALVCAACSEYLATLILADFRSEAFTAGLLHDIGKLFFRAYFFENYKYVALLQDQGQKTLIEAEKEVFGIDHPTIGKWLAEKWRLPEILVHAIWMHHYPPVAVESLRIGSPELKRLISIVHLADLLAHEILEDFQTFSSDEIAGNKSAGLLDLSLEEIKDVKAYAANCLSERSRFFELSDQDVSLHFDSLKDAGLCHILAREKPDCDLLNLYEIQREIAEINDEDYLLDLAANHLHARQAIMQWVIYTLDQRQKRLNGRCGAHEENIESFRAVHGNQPFFGKDLEELIQSGYSRFLKSKPLNPHSKDDGSEDTCLRIPLETENEFLGEIIIEPKGRYGYFSEAGFEREKAFCRFLASILAAVLSRIRLEEKLSEDAEGLSMAISKAAKLIEKPFAKEEGTGTLCKPLLLEQEEPLRKLDSGHEQLAAILEHIPHGIITTDTDGLITSLNKHSEILTGWSESEALGKPCHEVFNIFDTEINKACGNPVKEVLENGRPLHFPSYIALIAKDKTKQMIEATAAPFFARSGTAAGVVIMFQTRLREEPGESIPDILLNSDERRSSPRAQARLPVYLKGNNRFIEGETTSLSERGAYICCKEVLEPRQQCLMVIKPGDPYPLSSSIEIEVVWVNKNGSSNPSLPKGMGVRFLKVSARDRQLLLKLMSDN